MASGWVWGAPEAEVRGGRRSGGRADRLAPHYRGMRPRDQWVVITQHCARAREEEEAAGGSAAETSAAELGADPPPTARGRGEVRQVRPGGCSAGRDGEATPRVALILKAPSFSLSSLLAETSSALNSSSLGLILAQMVGQCPPGPSLPRNREGKGGKVG